ncbi:hypothetical protein MNEG_13691 [Monoraphidium neglectum]|uniref:YqgF/RNase H-like domain-containing protein n=1 Tax=Monoraphidium neglectum TaxID=145388 RepID=A0A0D2J2R7_9CHLO|nr:hypothetical protein MNEG_13691 [Monoraphidium neglectum]KIY94272.1 hypothetical protein MNEG_13691 [Monoraphidium neglectum]|eukprot:XP_013893292.1 hypothetical protein MNEG_13691 [Monoraphidium neglectum]
MPPRLQLRRCEQQLQAPRPSSSASAAAPAAAAAGPAAGAPRPRVPIPQRALGVDYGTVWTGLATGELGRGAPLRVARGERNNAAALCREVIADALAHGAGGIVVGIPLRPGQHAGDPSSDSPHASRCRSFAETLSIMAGASGIDVFLYNEARTSAAAMVQVNISATDRLGNVGRQRKNEKQVDAWSAAMLLTRFFQNPGSAVRVKLRSIERRAPAAQQQQQRHQQRPQRQPQQQRRPRQQHQPEAGAGMEGAAAAPSGDEDPGGSSSSSSDAAVGPSLPAAEEGAKG